MALFITLKGQHEEELEVDLIWHVGEHRPNIRLNRVTMVMADGHELEWVRTTFTNLPIHSGRIVRWYGDLARFIVLNLPWRSA